MTEHEKTGLMYTKYVSLYYGTYLLYCLTYLSSVNCIRFPMKCCINGGNVIRLLFLSTKLLKFEIQKCGQILCAHKPYFLMPGHKYWLRKTTSCFFPSVLITFERDCNCVVFILTLWIQHNFSSWYCC